MNQMVANLYANNTGPSSSSQGNSNVQMDTTTKSDEEQQTKRKQSSEKSLKKIKRKKPTETAPQDDIDGSVDFSNIIFNIYY
jgi:hypothetical protein